jgi:Mrp family chromosome partitioning ATPase
MARVFEALQQASAADPDYSGRFLEAYDFTHVLELPPGYEPRALPPASSEFWDPESGAKSEFDDGPLPYIDADIETDLEPHHYGGHGAELGDVMVAPAAASTPATSSLPPELRDEFKRLRNAIMLASEPHRPQVLLVCGVAPGDGASFVAKNLSLTLAEFDKLNVARFEIAGASVEFSNGISEGARSYQLALRSTDAPNLREIASPQGAVALNDLMRLCDIPAMMERLRSRFDYVLIDGPAISAHSDVALLAAQTDGVILVAQQNETKCARLDEARSALQSAQAKILGVVLNRRREALPKAIANVV